KFVKLSRSVPGLQEKVFHATVDRAKQGSIRAEEQRRLTQEILDNIGQGSFSINVAGEIGENYTSLAAEYLGVDNLAGIPFADLAFRKDREILRNYYRALHMLFGGKDYNHEIVLDLLPNEVSINGRSFKLYYSFVQDGAGHVMSVFIRMEDITLEQELAEKEEMERAINMKMQRNIGGFMDMLDEVESSFMIVERFADEYWAVSKQPPSEIIGEIMRNLHGAKGLCGQFELTKLKSIIHEFEDWFLAVDHKSIGEQPEKFKKLFVDFEQELQFALSFKENLGEGIVKILNGVSFTHIEFEKLENAARDGDLTTIKSLITNKSQVDAQRIVSNWNKDVARLAEKLNKKVVYKQEIKKGLTIPKEMAKVLNTNLGHLYRNCIDHGIETPEQRIRKGKGNTGKIMVTIDETKNILVISISDDGQGIDDQKISQIAIENKNLDQNLVKKYIDNEEYSKILFLPGFSSAVEKTDVSGRGVGLDAVKTTVERFGGEIDIQSTSGVGTSFNIRIPLDGV
ncbi:hypothetical protein KKA14_06025, partial [bacterium]|nr:hypothetical protein [bacterium]